MEKITIVSESKKGLFVDKKNENDISAQVRKAFANGHTSVELSENIVNSGKTLILTGFIERGATSKDSAFKYVSNGKEYICKELRQYFGLPVYTKKHEEKFSVCTNICLATNEQLETEIKRLQEELTKRKEAKAAKDKAQKDAAAKLLGFASFEAFQKAQKRKEKSK